MAPKVMAAIRSSLASVPIPTCNHAPNDAKEIFGIVRNQWMSSGMNGKELYEFAVKATSDLGWVLNLGLTGHRLSEFPHSAYYSGTLGAVSIRPSPKVVSVKRWKSSWHHPSASEQLTR